MTALNAQATCCECGNIVIKILMATKSCSLFDGVPPIQNPHQYRNTIPLNTLLTRCRWWQNLAHLNGTKLD